ncbi:MAG TPA: M48 family metallopeptidase [Bryobacteraceae bacterium]|nr:M48 family metallopeptidase [Bryobacteraceae bacterium]
MRPIWAGVLISSLSLTITLAADKESDPNQIGKRDVSKGFNCYSMEKEIAMGKQLAGEVQRQAKMLTDPLITEYVNRLGQNLVRNSDAKVPFSFQVIDDPALNAFALPGGFVFINTGLITAAETEAEMASAMAHEIAHVAARHMTRQACKIQLAKIASTPLIFLGGWGGFAAQQVASAAIPMTFLSFSRAYESEADYLGLQYLYAAGYDPQAALDMFEKMMSIERQKPGSISKVFATHPMSEDRLKKAQREIEHILPAKAAYIVNTSEYSEMRERWLAIENQRRMRAVEKDIKSPILRRAPGNGAPDQDEPDSRPTINRRGPPE